MDSLQALFLPDVLQKSQSSRGMGSRLFLLTPELRSLQQANNVM